MPRHRFSRAYNRLQYFPFRKRGYLILASFRRHTYCIETDSETDLAMLDLTAYIAPYAYILGAFIGAALFASLGSRFL